MARISPVRTLMVIAMPVSPPTFCTCWASRRSTVHCSSESIVSW
jgi:hypothetical protein